MPVTLDAQERVAAIRVTGEGPENLLSASIIPELNERLAEFDAEPMFRVAQLLGGEHSFGAGWAPVSLARTSSEDLWQPKLPSPKAPTINPIPGAIFRPGKPIVAGVVGACLDEALVLLARASDIRVAGASARFGFPGFRHGRGAGATIRSQLHTEIPYVQLMWLVLTGGELDADQALRSGLVNEVVADDEVVPRTEAIANLIASQAPIGSRGEATAVMTTSNLPIRDAAFVARVIGQMSLGPQHLAGVSAILGKGRPEFRDLVRPVKDAGE